MAKHANHKPKMTKMPGKCDMAKMEKKMSPKHE